MAYGGDAVGHDAEGRAVFVEGGCPGDVVDVQIVADKDRWAKGRITSLVSSSESRVKPSCGIAEQCGGCSWQHVAYEEQLAAKRQAVVDALQRIGGERDPQSLVEEVAPSAPYGYRNKIELLASTSASRLALGFARAGSNEIVPVDTCELLPRKHANAPKALSGALRFLSGRHELNLARVGLRVSKRTGDVEVALWTPPGAFPRKAAAETLATAVKATSVVRVLFKGPIKERRVTGVEVLGGRGLWREVLSEFSYGISAPTFFQVNSAQAEVLVRNALELLEPDGSDRVLDLFAGAGTFTLPLAELAGEVVAVEASSSAIKDLRRNLEHAALDADVIGGDADRELPTLGSFDLALVDPPRSGLAPSSVDALASARPRKIAYVSCDPATLARDIARFRELGYAVTAVRPVDLFPQTFHVESVALLERG